MRTEQELDTLIAEEVTKLSESPSLLAATSHAAGAKVSPQTQTLNPAPYPEPCTLNPEP